LGLIINIVTLLPHIYARIKRKHHGVTMKLKKADRSPFHYPSKKYIKPILWSVGTAFALSGCGTQEVKPPALIAGGIAGPVIGYPPKTPAKKTKPPHVEKKKQVVEEPEVLGGIVPVEPEK